MSTAVNIVVSVPISVTNTIFFYWILSSLGRTLSYLKDQKQSVKVTLIRQFTISIMVALLIAAIFIVFHICINLIGTRDKFWKFQWVTEVCWFAIFTGNLFWIMRILRPNANSKQLAHMEELNEESIETT